VNDKPKKPSAKSAGGSAKLAGGSSREEEKENVEMEVALDTTNEKGMVAQLVKDEFIKFDNDCNVLALNFPAMELNNVEFIVKMTASIQRKLGCLCRLDFENKKKIDDHYFIVPGYLDKTIKSSFLGGSVLCAPPIESVVVIPRNGNINSVCVSFSLINKEAVASFGNSTTIAFCVFLPSAGDDTIFANAVWKIISDSLGDDTVSKGTPAWADCFAIMAHSRQKSSSKINRSSSIIRWLNVITPLNKVQLIRKLFNEAMDGLTKLPYGLIDVSGGKCLWVIAYYHLKLPLMSRAIIFSNYTIFKISGSDCNSACNALSLFINNNSFDPNNIMAVTVSKQDAGLFTIKFLLSVPITSIDSFLLSAFGINQMGSVGNIPAASTARAIAMLFDLVGFNAIALEVEERLSTLSLNPDPTLQSIQQKSNKNAARQKAPPAPRRSTPGNPTTLSAVSSRQRNILKVGGGLKALGVVPTMAVSISNNSFAALEDAMSSDVESHDGSNCDAVVGSVPSVTMTVYIPPPSSEDGDGSDKSHSRKRQAADKSA